LCSTRGVPILQVLALPGSALGVVLSGRTWPALERGVGYVRSHVSTPLTQPACLVAFAALLLIIGGTQASADPSQTRFKIAWSACENSPQTQCGTLKVPLDWSKPSGATISLAIARRPAKDPQHRVGTLFFNPGGPGDGAVEYITTHAEDVFTPTLIERFDLVGMDPRGIANSSPVRCTLPLITPRPRCFPRPNSNSSNW
jgi:hypothetical protein